MVDFLNWHPLLCLLFNFIHLLLNGVVHLLGNRPLDTLVVHVLKAWSELMELVNLGQYHVFAHHLAYEVVRSVRLSQWNLLALKIKLGDSVVDCVYVVV